MCLLPISKMPCVSSLHHCVAAGGKTLTNDITFHVHLLLLAPIVEKTLSQKKNDHNKDKILSYCPSILVITISPPVFFIDARSLSFYASHTISAIFLCSLFFDKWRNWLNLKCVVFTHCTIIAIVKKIIYCILLYILLHLVKLHIS